MWKDNALSQDGHSILIQSNLATKANFQIQSFSFLKVFWLIWLKPREISFGIKIFLVKVSILLGGIVFVNLNQMVVLLFVKLNRITWLSK